MSSELLVHVGPEAQELARKRQEVARLQTELAERELLLANLRAELAAFQRRYLREVGMLYAELDDLSAKIAEWLSRNSSPRDAAYDEWNAKIAELADEDPPMDEFSFVAARHRRRADGGKFIFNEEEDFHPSTDLKSLYREVAKRVHPDLATDDADRHKRDLLMKEVNDAYQRGDHEALRRILEEYESGPESVRGKGVAADLERVTRQIKQITARLSAIERDVSRLMKSDIGKLRAKAEAAMAEGRDLLREMAADLGRRIEINRRQVELRSTVERNK